MKQCIIKRLLLIVITLFGLITITFMVARVAPGDPARVAAGPDATEKMVQVLREEFGLNKNLLLRYTDYIRGLLASIPDSPAGSIRSRASMAASPASSLRRQAAGSIRAADTT
jgi:ABC-type dipeptide/oligopeptide/nickel transport system permease component